MREVLVDPQCDSGLYPLAFGLRMLDLGRWTLDAVSSAVHILAPRLLRLRLECQRPVRRCELPASDLCRARDRSRPRRDPTCERCPSPLARDRNGPRLAFAPVIQREAFHKRSF